MDSGKIYIGWGCADITPEKKVLLAGLVSARMSERIESRISVTALALETRKDDGESLEQTVMVSCDLAFIAFKAELLEQLAVRIPELNPDKITVNATHTHSAPAYEKGMYEEPEDKSDFMNPDEYKGFMINQICQAVSDAWESRKAGGISRGFDHAAVGHCRRAVYYNDTALMYGDTASEEFRALEGSEDHSVNMLFTWDTNNKLTGILVNLACPSQCDEAEQYISADFWAEVREKIAGKFSPEIYLLPQCSAAGDQAPHILVNKTEEAEMRQRRGVSRKEVIACKIISAVENAYEYTSDFIEDSLVLDHKIAHFTLPLRMVTEEEYEVSKKSFKANGTPWRFGLIGDIVKRYEYQKKVKTHSIESHIIRVGDAVFATNPFELFLDFGLVIKNRSTALQTFIVQLSDATEFYLPTERAQRRGHYSAIIQSNWVGAEGGRVLVGETVTAISELFDEPLQCNNTRIQFNDKK